MQFMSLLVTIVGFRSLVGLIYLSKSVHHDNPPQWIPGISLDDSLALMADDDVIKLLNYVPGCKDTESKGVCSVVVIEEIVEDNVVSSSEKDSRLEWHGMDCDNEVPMTNPFSLRNLLEDFDVEIHNVAIEHDNVHGVINFLTACCGDNKSIGSLAWIRRIHGYGYGVSIKLAKENNQTTLFATTSLSISQLLDISIVFSSSSLEIDKERRRCAHSVRNAWIKLDSILQAGNPIKEILLKLNLPDHSRSSQIRRIFKDRGEDLKSNTTEDVISIGSFMEVSVLNHYVLGKKILLIFWVSTRKWMKMEKGQEKQVQWYNSKASPD
ncbi:hypothetical protein Tco_0807282 [Tanacetum coccineum]